MARMGSSATLRHASLGLLALAVSAGAAAQPTEPGVSHALAIARAARVSDIRYALTFILKPQAESTQASEILTFTDSGTGDLPLDYRDGTVQTAILNGNDISTELVNGHLNLPAARLAKGLNQLKVGFTSNIAAAGKAITRYTDKDDGKEYYYTLFVPMDASMAFPCFDQPDLKSRFTLSVVHPQDWKVIANTSEDLIDIQGPVKLPGGVSGTRFIETKPISTYLFAFAAGPWHGFPGMLGEPTLWVRESQVARAKAEAPQVQQTAVRGIKYLEEYFKQPFPFPKYDLVLIPGFPFGGMEHAGATFLNEDGVLFRTAPTEADYFRRNILVLHETTHQWFGDLVTMRWFDDLWLKEGFAQYMAYKAAAELEPTQDPWKHFYEDIKPAAYGIDETQGTTPIFQNIANLKDAKSAYGAIVYQKAPAVLKQLNYFLGEDNFRDGLRLYLKQHAYANAQWSDLVDAFAKTGGQPGRKDVHGWAKAWILQRGMPQVTASFRCGEGKLTDLSLTQEDVLGQHQTWPISNEVLLDFPVTGDTPHRNGGRIGLPVQWSTPSFHVKEAIGKPCPRYVFANFQDYAYGRFLLDAASEASIKEVLTTPTPQSDPLLHSMLWGALWDNVHVAKSPSREYVQLALKMLPDEPDESMNRIQGGRIGTALHAYLSPKGREALVPQVEQTIADRMLNAPTLGLRIVNFHSYTSLAETPEGLHRIKDILALNLEVPGLKLRPLDRWNMIGHLIAQNDPEAGDALAYEKMHDKSGEGQKYAYAVQAGTPDATVKARYFEQYLHDKDIQEDWITQSLRPFNSWNQTSLTEPYLARALDELPEIKLHRKIFFLGAWLGAFIDGQDSASAQAIVHQWLAKPGIDPDLRLKVLELSDALDRTVLIRSKFPE